MLDDSTKSSVTEAAPSGGNAAPTVNKRAVLRCAFTASAEVMDHGSQSKLSARTSEIGLGGCYVDTLSPFADGTLVHIRIIRDVGVFESDAKVVYVHDGFGMGLAFTNISLDQRRLLQGWLAELVAKLKPTP